MTITMNTALSNHCVTASAKYDSLNGMASKIECQKLIDSLTYHSQRTTPNGKRFSASKRADQRKVIKLAKKRLKGLPKLSKTLILVDESLVGSTVLLRGELETPDRSRLSAPNPAFHVSIRADKSKAFLEITQSKDDGCYHDLIREETLYSDSLDTCLNNALKRAEVIMNIYGIKIRYDD